MPGRLDAFDGSDPFAGSHRSGSSKKNDAFADFYEFNPGRVSIDWGKALLCISFLSHWQCLLQLSTCWLIVDTY